MVKNTCLSGYTYHKKGLRLRISEARLVRWRHGFVTEAWKIYFPNNAGPPSAALIREYEETTCSSAVTPLAIHGI
jgi:hypothetical protein